MRDITRELVRVLNSQSAENGSDTPDHVLAAFLSDCLAAFDNAVNAREKHRGPLLAESVTRALRERAEYDETCLFSHPDGRKLTVAQAADLLDEGDPAAVQFATDLVDVAIRKIVVCRKRANNG